MILRRFAVLFLAALLCVFALGCGVGAATPTTTTTLSPTTTTVATTTAVKTTTHIAAATTVPATSYEDLDPTYEQLLLVNAEHPLPSDFDNTDQLTEIEKKYLNGSLNQIDQYVYPYLMAMLKDARAQGVTLYVRSPHRSYATQKYLFERKVNNLIKAGTAADKAEAKAAQAVARPGTSEHQTGLAVDINVASSTFEKSPGFTWMMENAENYGFILRYPKDKTDVTGIMYEAWHWRFVGINAAKEINDLGVVLEEYLALKQANSQP